MGLIKGVVACWTTSHMKCCRTCDFLWGSHRTTTPKHWGPKQGPSFLTSFHVGSTIFFWGGVEGTQAVGVRGVCDMKD